MHSSVLHPSTRSSSRPALSHEDEHHIPPSCTAFAILHFQLALPPFSNLYAMIFNFKSSLFSLRTLYWPHYWPLSSEYVTVTSSHLFNTSLIISGPHIQPQYLLTCFIFSLFRLKAENLKAIIFDSYLPNPAFFSYASTIVTAQPLITLFQWCLNYSFCF